MTTTDPLNRDAAQTEPDDVTPGPCARCFGRGYYRKDASSFFMCTCPASIAHRQDAQSNLGKDWSDEDVSLPNG